jgi:hypothetical protein
MEWFAGHSFKKIGDVGRRAHYFVIIANTYVYVDRSTGGDRSQFLQRSPLQRHGLHTG